MKKASKGLSIVMAAGCFMGLASLAACGNKDEALNVGAQYVVAESQLSALTYLDNGTADVAIIDSVMAGYYTSTGEYASKMQIVDGLIFSEESYGIAGRKEDKAFLSKINEALLAIRETDYATLAEKYGLTTSVSLTADVTNPYAGATDNSWEEIKQSKKITIGYTVFAPIAYTADSADAGADGKLTGFDIELARAVAAWLNAQEGTEIELEFTEIDWNAKETLLKNGTIDLIWNGLTITEDRETQMCISVPYLYNKQVAVVLKEDADKYTTKESMKNAIMTAETGSAGESVIKGD